MFSRSTKSSGRCFFCHMLQFTFAGFEIQHIASSENQLTITARALTPTSACPSCQHVSNHVHSYYTRSPQDLPISGRKVVLMLGVRRFHCSNPQCSRQTFAERLPHVTGLGTANKPTGNDSESIAIVLGGQAGSRLADQLAMEVECRHASETS